VKFYQKEVKLKSRSRGFHIITDEILREVPEIGEIGAGICNIFIKHTSASLCLNENASPDVRTDLEKFFNKLVPDDTKYFEHTYEGGDDMPAHVKSVVIGNSLTIPITKGELNIGTWQGVYLCEHRNRAGGRKIVITCYGD
jgi:secondary thiamine-phosphate synthase enzyme